MEEENKTMVLEINNTNIFSFYGKVSTSNSFIRHMNSYYNKIDEKTEINNSLELSNKNDYSNNS